MLCGLRQRKCRVRDVRVAGRSLGSRLAQVVGQPASQAKAFHEIEPAHAGGAKRPAENAPVAVPGAHDQHARESGCQENPPPVFVAQHQHQPPCPKEKQPGISRAFGAQRQPQRKRRGEKPAGRAGFPIAQQGVKEADSPVGHDQVVLRAGSLQNRHRDGRDGPACPRGFGPRYQHLYEIGQDDEQAQQRPPLHESRPAVIPAQQAQPEDGFLGPRHLVNLSDDVGGVGGYAVVLSPMRHARQVVSPGIHRVGGADPRQVGSHAQHKGWQPPTEQSFVVRAAKACPDVPIHLPSLPEQQGCQHECDEALCCEGWGGGEGVQSTKGFGQRHQRCRAHSRCHEVAPHHRLPQP